MPLNFPLNPSAGQSYTQGNFTWVYNGVQWITTVTLGYRGSTGFQGSQGFLGSYGYQGCIGFQGSTGFQGSIGFMGSLGQANVVFGDVAPSNPYTGLLWFDTNNALFTAYYESANNWIAVNGGANGPTGYTGSSGFTGSIGFTGSAGPSSLPVVNTSIVYIPTVADIGDLISTSANVIISNGIFSQGHTFTIYNNSLANTVISPNTGVTLIWAGVANTGQRILLPRGLASVICVNTTSNTFVISGNLL